MNDRERRDATAGLMRALANPHRIGIIELLSEDSRCVHELTEALGIGQPLVSQHLRILRSAALLRTDRRGKEVVYSLADKHVSHIVGDASIHVQEQQ